MMTTTPKTGLIEVPDQLCDGRFGFVKLKRESKRPFERNWQKRPYSLAQINAWIGQGFNYGVLGGHGGLIVVDTDTDEMSRFIERLFPPTFTVKTPKNGYHFLFYSKQF